MSSGISPESSSEEDGECARPAVVDHCESLITVAPNVEPRSALPKATRDDSSGYLPLSCGVCPEYLVFDHEVSHVEYPDRFSYPGVCDMVPVPDRYRSE